MKTLLGQLSVLLQPRGGLFVGVTHLPTDPDDARYRVVMVNTGKLRFSDRPDASFVVTGCGTGFTEEEALVPAIAEGLERYSSSRFLQEQFLVATANELGADAIDLSSLPVCSTRELSDLSCPLMKPERGKPLRWVRAVRLRDGKCVYIPSVLVYLHISYNLPAERICFPISTGCAAHSTLEQAVLSALLEVIERDAISILWLQKLPFPRVIIDIDHPKLRHHLNSYELASSGIQYHFFDASTDLGIPVIYGIRTSVHSPKTLTLVACSAALDGVEATAKVFKDLATVPIGFRNSREIPGDISDFAGIYDGATYMADAQRSNAFNFLLKTRSTRLLSEISNYSSLSTDPLRSLVKSLASKGIDAYAVVTCPLKLIQS